MRMVNSIIINHKDKFHLHNSNSCSFIHSMQMFEPNIFMNGKQKASQI